MASASVIPLLSSWEEYISIKPDGDIRGFARWILDTEKTPPPAPPANPDDNTRIPLLISRLHRILHQLSKPIAKTLGLTNDMEFDLLVHIAIMDHPNKKQLCHELLIENSTGVEITKRLAQRGFITERPDPKDRRSARLSLTEKGKRSLLQGYEKLAAIHSSFLGSLADEQKKELAHLLTLINKQDLLS
jgi:DNA-binding MarR family transcriptional regulator